MLQNQPALPYLLKCRLIFIRKNLTYTNPVCITFENNQKEAYIGTIF